jgi:hypothetical protein
MVGIVLTDGISRVVLAPAGPPALGYPTRIEVATGPFSATIEAEALDYKRFLDALRRLHETLVGEAELTFVEGGHSYGQQKVLRERSAGPPKVLERSVLSFPLAGPGRALSGLSG